MNIRDHRQSLMAFRLSAVVFCLIVLALMGGAAAQSPAPANPSAIDQAIDPHALYEQRCSGCHEAHAGDFARDTLERRGDAIFGRRTGEELRSVLAGGHGKLSPPEVVVMVAQLAFILDAGALFREKCFICHGRAAEFARSALVVRDGTLYGRYSHRETAPFMENHGRLNGPQVATVLAMLKAQLATQPVRSTGTGGH